MYILEFLHKYSSLVNITQQRFEKLNNQTTTADYVKSTNHKFQPLDATVQLLQKRNRIEYL